MILAFACLLSAASCSRDGRVIPKKKMAEIYADMFVADQWIGQNYKASRVADTSLFYESVLQRYGYTSEDYRKSVGHYMADPDRFARILRRTVLVLEDRMEEHKAELRKLKSQEAAAPDVMYDFDFSRIWIFDNGFPRQASRDSLGYFQGKQEYFILDLQNLVDPVKYGFETYFPQDSVITAGSPEPADTTAADDSVKAEGLAERISR